MIWKERERERSREPRYIGIQTSCVESEGSSEIFSSFFLLLSQSHSQRERERDYGSWIKVFEGVVNVTYFIGNSIFFSNIISLFILFQLWGNKLTKK